MDAKVGVLAIGNEVVEGQITNRNASWLSQKISELGAQPLYHLSCRDVESEITASLNFLSKECHLVLVSGGLGPTRDDGTREALANWVGSPLELNNEQWQIIQDKLNGRGVTLRDGHKRQALIPQGAKVLSNDKGVAPGFFIKAQPCFVASLPGPPNELHFMFNEYLLPLIKKEIAPRATQKLHTWICLGAPESEVAHISESILGADKDIGYRLHKPYVEVKFWAPLDIDDELQKRMNTLEEKLKPWLVARSIPEIRKTFHDSLAKFNFVFIIDHLSSGLFLEKLKEDFSSDNMRYQCFEHKSFRFFTKAEVEMILNHMQAEMSDANLFISLFPESESSALVAFNDQIESIKLPERIPLRSKLGQLYIIEQCFLRNNKFQ